MVKETTLYDILEIQPTASDSDIRKAYHKLAKRLHPDKNRDDPQAQQKFNKLKEAYEILSDPVQRETYDANGYEFLKLMEDPMAAFSSPDGLSKLLSSVSSGVRNMFICVFIIIFLAIDYFFITLGLKIDNGISWSWSIVFIPLYIVEVCIVLYSLYTIINSLKRCCRPKHHKADIEQELNYYDEDPNQKRNNEDEDPTLSPPLINLFDSLNAILFIISTITMAVSLDTKNMYFTISLIPYFLFEIFSVLIKFVEACYQLTDWIDAIINIVSLIRPLTILFCTLIYDGISTWSYTQAFIPVWIYFLVSFLRDAYRIMIGAKCLNSKMTALEIADYKRTTCNYILFDIVFFIVVLCIFLKIIGREIYIFWVFFPFLLIYTCFGLFFVCSIAVVLKNPQILEATTSMPNMNQESSSSTSTETDINENGKPIPLSSPNNNYELHTSTPDDTPLSQSTSPQPSNIDDIDDID